MTDPATKLSDNIDLANPKDAAMLARMMERNKKAYRKPRFDLSNTFMEKIVGCTEAGMDHPDPVINLGATRIGVELVKINQADDHVAERYERLDNGQQVGDVVLKIEAPRTLGPAVQVDAELEKELGLDPAANIDTTQPIPSHEDSDTDPA